MQNGWKSMLLGGLAFVFALGGYAYLSGQVSDLTERLAQSEDKLRQVEKNAAKAATAAPAAPAVPQDMASAMELDALRNELTDLKKALAGLQAAPAGATGGEVGGTAVAAADFSQDKLAAIKKVVEDTLEERNKAERNRWAGMTEDFIKNRRQQVVDDLEKRLQLTAFQKEQITTVLDEQTKDVMGLMGSMFSGDRTGREEARKKLGELETGTDTKVKQLLTVTQQTEYDTWKQETGGFRGQMGGMGGMGGARIRMGGGGNTGGTGGTGGAKEIDSSGIK